MGESEKQRGRESSSRKMRGMVQRSLYTGRPPRRIEAGGKKRRLAPFEMTGGAGVELHGYGGNTSLDERVYGGGEDGIRLAATSLKRPLSQFATSDAEAPSGPYS